MCNIAGHGKERAGEQESQRPETPQCGQQLYRVELTVNIYILSLGLNFIYSETETKDDYRISNMNYSWKLKT